MTYKEQHVAGVTQLVVGGLCAVVIFTVSFIFPSNQWDLLGHLGGAIHFETDDKALIHQRTYQIAQETIDAESYKELLDGGYPARKVWAADPESFYQLLPFYEPRVLVTYPAHLASQFGYNPLQYMRVQSSIAAAAAVFILTLLAARFVRPIAFVLVFPLLVFIAGTLEVARFEGADALSLLGYTIATVLILRRSALALLVVALLPLTRSDMVIYCFPVLLYCLYLFKGSRLLVLAAMAGALLSYIVVNAAFNNYGWHVQFYVALIEYQQYPADQNLCVTVGGYIGAIVKGVQLLLDNYQFQVFAVVVVVIGAAASDLIRKERLTALLNEPMIVLSIIAVLYVVLHFFAFPLMHTRYFVGQYLHVFTVALIVMSRWRDFRMLESNGVR